MIPFYPRSEVMHARLLPKFASFYPSLDPERRYAVSPRGLDDTRPEGATRSAGGPVPSEGVWLVVDAGEYFVFRHHVQLEPSA